MHFANKISIIHVNRIAPSRATSRQQGGVCASSNRRNLLRTLHVDRITNSYCRRPLSAARLHHSRYP